MLHLNFTFLSNKKSSLVEMSSAAGYEVYVVFLEKSITSII